MATSGTDSATTYILLIRHGENDWVGENRLAGRTPGVYLNDAGKNQSKRIAEALAKQELSAVYSSPMERCMQTARPVAEAHSLQVIEEPGVWEVDYGGWQGGSLKELSKSPEWQLVQHSPSSFRFPDGETLFEVQARGVSTVERLRRQHPNQVIAIFSHGDVIRTTLAHYLGIPFDLFQRVLINTASISAIVFHGAVPRVLFTNHLTELPKFEFKKDESEDESAGAEAAQTGGSSAPGAEQSGNGKQDGRPPSVEVL
ncbi:MAG: histidine phosphatase family protein [Chloroflexota bacterium]